MVFTFGRSHLIILLLEDRGVPIRVGDKIVKINEIDITGYSLQSVMKVFADDTTSTDKPRKISIIRGGESQVIIDV